MPSTLPALKTHRALNTFSAETFSVEIVLIFHPDDTPRQARQEAPFFQPPQQAEAAPARRTTRP